MQRPALGLLLTMTFAGCPALADEGLELWDKIHEVLSHPRCANCHVEDGRPMWSGEHYGEEPRVHPMNIGGNPVNEHGEPGAMCGTCHGPANSTLLHGPPGAPGDEGWRMPKADMAWFDKPSHQICEQIKDPSRTGKHSIVEIAEHVSDDPLVLWSWRPGPGRQPAPYSVEELVDFILRWNSVGAPCPAG